MNRPYPFYLASLACAALLFSGCIQEDPQMKALQDRLQKAESQLKSMGERERSEAGSAAGREAESQIAVQKAKIAELEAKVRDLSEENANLKRAGSTASAGPLGNRELLEKLNEASLPMREKIRPLYEIERAVLRELSIPESPFSCVVHLDLVNLATDAMEEVEVRATANLRGEWRFPPVERIASDIRPRGQSAVAASSPPSGAGQTGQVQGGARPGFTGERDLAPQAGGNAAEAPRRSNARSAPASLPVIGELAGETVLDW